MNFPAEELTAEQLSELANLLWETNKPASIIICKEVHAKYQLRIEELLRAIFTDQTEDRRKILAVALISPLSNLVSEIQKKSFFHGVAALATLCEQKMNQPDQAPSNERPN